MLHYITLKRTHYTTTNATATTLHELHHTITTTPLHYNYNYSCTTPNYIQQLWVRWRTRWPLQPLQPLQKTQLKPPFGPSVDSLCHPWFTTAILSYRFPSFETSATALCSTTGTMYISYIYIYISCVYHVNFMYISYMMYITCIFNIPRVYHIYHVYIMYISCLYHMSCIYHVNTI